MTNKKPDDLSEFKDLYIKTSRESIQKAQNSLLKLRKNPFDKEMIEKVLRIAHTLKGRAAVMGDKEASLKSGSLEDLFREIQKGRKKLTPDLLKSVSQSFEAIAVLIDKVERG